MAPGITVPNLGFLTGANIVIAKSKDTGVNGGLFVGVEYENISLSNNGSFTLSDTGMDVKYEYTKGSDYKYNFESNFELDKLADVSGAKLILKGDNTQSVSGTLEYNTDAAAGKVQFPFSVGLAPVEGLEVGVSGTVTDKPDASQLYEKVSVNYSQSGFGAFIGLSKNFAALEARGIYQVNDDTKVAIKAADVLKGAPELTVGAEYKVDGETTAKVVVAQKDLGIKAGVKKTLSKGVDLTVGYAVKAADLADVSKHSVGFTLDCK